MADYVTSVDAPRENVYADMADYVTSVDAPRENVYADMAELVDALASGASVRKNVEVQVLLSAPK